MVRKIVIFLFLSGLFLNCATSIYRSADHSLDQGLHQKALREYLKILHQDKRNNGTYTDTRALLGAASSYYQMEKYSKTQKMCKVILKLDSHNGGALFYAGSSLHEQGKSDWALKFYKQFPRIASNDPFRPFLEAKYNLIMQEEVARKMRAAIRRERSIDVNKIRENSVAVLYFVSSDENAESDALSKGIAEMLITDLSLIRQLKVIERIKLQKLIEEMQMGTSGLTDPNTMPRFGKFLGARTLVSGAFTISGSELHITTSLADVKQTKTYDADKYAGQLENIFSIEKDLVLGVLDQMGIELSFSEQEQILQVPTHSFEAFMSYCYGLDLMDQGRYSSALSSFQQAINVDPTFKLAQNKYKVLSAMNVITGGGPIMHHIHANRGRGQQGKNFMHSGGSSRPPIALGAKGRLERMSFHLDLGYLPGRESRNDAVELRTFDVSLERTKLPEPPLPPTNGN